VKATTPPGTNGDLWKQECEILVVGHVREAVRRNALIKKGEKEVRYPPTLYMKILFGDIHTLLLS